MPFCDCYFIYLFVNYLIYFSLFYFICANHNFFLPIFFFFYLFSHLHFNLTHFCWVTKNKRYNTNRYLCVHMHVSPLYIITLHIILHRYVSCTLVIDKTSQSYLYMEIGKFVNKIVVRQHHLHGQKRSV